MPTILAVDDEPAALYATARELRNAGFTVRRRLDGRRDAGARRRGPDLVVLDIKLPT